MSENIKNILIIQTSDLGSEFVAELVESKDSAGNIIQAKEYVFEGIFGEIGVKNKNNRIYDAVEYVPQIESLQEKIQKGALLGELDHPKSFDVSLSNVSHKIEKVEYSSKDKKVYGRIRLLDTDAGKNAKALVDANVPLHISSRAAGVVESNGHVKIKQLFTYDLVADPGFANAELKRLNESFGLPEDSNIQIFELPEENIDEKEETKSDVIAEIKNNDDDTYNNKNKKTNNMEKSYLKEDDFEKYSNYISEELTAIKESINNIPEMKKDDNTEIVNKSIAYMKMLAEKVDHLISHNDYIIEGLNNTKKYIEHVAEVADKGIQYTESVAEKADKGLLYTESLAEKLDQSIQFTEHIAESAHFIKEYTQYLSEKVDDSYAHNDYIAENATKFNKKVQNLIKYSEYLKESIETIESGSTNGVNENANTFTNTEDTSIDTYKNEISNKLDKILESAKKQTAEPEELHFLKFVNEDKKKEFAELSDEAKQKLTERFKTKDYFGKSDVERIWENVMNPNRKVALDFIKDMPEVYVDQWEALSDDRRKQIVAESKFHKLDTEERIEKFWKTRDLREKSIEIEKIDENKKTETTEKKVLISEEKANSIIQKVKMLRNEY